MKIDPKMKLQRSAEKSEKRLPLKKQGFMHRVLEQPFAEAEKKNIPCVLDTDTPLKVKKYIRCGMEMGW